MIGVSYQTVNKWISVLETSFIVYLLRPYHKNFDKRIVKSPKLYFYDTGLACALLNLRNVEDLNRHSKFATQKLLLERFGVLRNRPFTRPRRTAFARRNQIEPNHRQPLFWRTQIFPNLIRCLAHRKFPYLWWGRSAKTKRRKCIKLAKFVRNPLAIL